MKRFLPISKIVTHHSAGVRDANNAATLVSIDKNHAARLHPERNGFGLHVAYHFLIFGDGVLKETRPLNEIGYHAGNFLINVQSIGICLVGNFVKEEPSTAQLVTLRQLLSRLQKEYKIEAKNVLSHRKIKSTACPGTNMNDTLIFNLAIGNVELPEDKQHPSDWAKIYWDKAVSLNIIEDKNPQGDLTIKDLEIILSKLGVINSLEGKVSRERLIVAMARLNAFPTNL